jgi:PAS domain-containing protein
VWTIWEPNTIDNLDYKYINKPGCTRIGSFSTTYYKVGNEIKLENSSSDGELFVGDYYTIPKKEGREILMDAYYYSYTGNEQDKIFQTSTIIPIKPDGKFKGVVGFDISLESFQPVIDKIKILDSGYALIISSTGIIIASPNKELVGKDIRDFYGDIIKKNNVFDKIKLGKQFSFNYDDIKMNRYSNILITPFTVGNTGTNWSIITVVPVDEINSQAKVILKIAILIGLLGLIVVVFLVWLVIGRITKPLSQIASLIKNLNKADLGILNNIYKKFNNEVGKIAHSTYLLINWLNKTGQFANEIKNKNYKAEYKLLNKNDILGESLLDMRDHLIKADKEEHKRMLENKQHIWYSEGIGKAAELIRDNSDSIEKMTSAILSFIIDYVDAIQGGIFIIDSESDDSKQLYNLKAAVAYGRKKIVNKTIKMGEGLVGRCAFEKQYILLTEIPQDYLDITSGLGTTNPDCILMVPMVLNEKALGVIELASFNVFKEYQINFIEKVCESVASAISNLQINERTKELLEKSKAQSEMLASQEEEMRQNFEEMQATQEEQERLVEDARNKHEYLYSIINGIPDGVCVVDIDGNIVEINSAFTTITGYKNSELAGKNFDIVFEAADVNQILTSHNGEIIITTKTETKSKVFLKTNILNVNNKRMYLFLLSA